MKKIMAMNILAALLACGGLAHADDGALARQIVAVEFSNPVRIANMINWKIGEFQDYNISLQGFPMGTIHKEATSEEGNAVWLTEDMDGSMIGKHKTEVLIDRADGHIIKMKQDGKEQAPPEDKIEIVKQETASVTVPAGTFETIHITAKSEKAGEIEIWANPRDITLDGVAKTTLSANGMPIALELTKMGGR